MDRVLSDEEGSSIAWKYGTFSLHARMELTAAWALGPDGWRLDDRRGNADSGTTRTRFRGNPGVTTLFGLPEMSFRVDVESCIMLHDVERGADIFRGSRCSQHWSTSRAGSHPSENHPYPTSPSITQVPAFRTSCSESQIIRANRLKCRDWKRRGAVVGWKSRRRNPATTPAFPAIPHPTPLPSFNSRFPRTIIRHYTAFHHLRRCCSRDLVANKLHPGQYQLLKTRIPASLLPAAALYLSSLCRTCQPASLHGGALTQG